MSAKFHLFAISTALCLLGLSGSPRAEESEARIELTPWLGYAVGGSFTDRVTGEDLELDDSLGYGLTLNVLVNDHSSLEIYYSRQDTQADARGLFMAEPVFDLNIQKLEFGGAYDVYAKYPRPYVAATIGATRLDPSDTGFDSDTYFSFSLGGGLKLFEHRQLGVRLDARWLGTFVNEDTDVFCRTGSGAAICLIEADGDLLSQLRLFLGVSLRF